MIRLVIAFLCAATACMLVAGAIHSSAQSSSANTPDAYFTQITASNRSGTTQVGSFASDITANGRFVVIESNGDIATEKTATRNNQDGNREIFLYDYAQRRIFQLTNTRSVACRTCPSPTPAASPSPSPSPSPSVSPSPSPTVSPTPPADEPTNTQIEISNNRPMISVEPTLVGGNRTYTIVFSSNAPSPANFDGTAASAADVSALQADGNEEIWIYKFTVADTANLSSGADIGFTDLTTGTFTRITNTPASRAPSPGGTAGGTSFAPFIADDNRDATINDNGTVIAFTSTRDLTPGAPGNLDPTAVDKQGNPEIFIANISNPAAPKFTQVTNTVTSSFNNPIFSSNPSLSGDGSVITFISNADLVSNNPPDATTKASSDQIYVANYNVATGAISGMKQATKTKNGLPVPAITPTPGASPTATISPDPTATGNLLIFGRRMSRDGRYVGFESLAADPKANATNTSAYAPFVYDISTDTFTQLGPRATDTQIDPILHVPVFTDYGQCAGAAPLTPCSVAWSSALNYTPNGTLVTDTTGLNPNSVTQFFLAPLPAVSTGPFTRISNFPLVGGGSGMIASNSRRRFAFTRSADMGFNNSDFSAEVFYELSPPINTESTNTLTLFTGASSMSVPIASPTATPSPTISPTPSPSPSPSPSASPSVSPTSSPAGFAAGELAVVQANPSFGPVTAATVSNANASELLRTPDLPIELSGVSVSINGAACGLYSVSSTQVKFVVPIGLPQGTYPIAVNVTDTVTPEHHTVFRGGVNIVGAQPDIFTSTNGAGGRAVVCNATNPAGCTPEPFNITSNDGTGNQVATILRASLTGVRNNLASGITVTIGTTPIIANTNTASDLPGTDLVTFTLPANVDTGDVPIVISSGGFTSRDKTTAPHITINPAASPSPSPIVNPIDGNSFFVTQQYQDFLNRAPDAAGLQFWTNNINQCGTDANCIAVQRINTSAAFFLSIEFQQTGYLVYRTYKAAFGDINPPAVPVPVVRQQFLPDTRAIGNGVIVNQDGWQTMLETNKQNYFANFVTRSDFVSKYPANMTAQDFVNALYSNAGVASGSAPNRAAALNEFSSAPPTDNAARARALRDVAEDSMLYQQEFNKAFVLMEYFGYLQRNPSDPPDSDYSGYNFWLGKLNQFNGDYLRAEMVKAFISSSEYRQRFGQ